MAAGVAFAEVVALRCGREFRGWPWPRARAGEWRIIGAAEDPSRRSIRAGCAGRRRELAGRLRRSDRLMAVRVIIE